MRLDQYKNRNGKIWLNIASSIYVIEDFINLDNHLFIPLVGIYDKVKFLIPTKYEAMFEAFKEAKASAPLIRHDCRKKLFFPDNSIDHILCSHFIEHVYPDEANQILADFFRVLKPGATCHLIVPDLNLQVREYINDFNAGQSDAADKLVRRTLLSRDSRGSFKYRVLEFFGSFGLQHLWMYDSTSLAKRMNEVGFKLLDSNETASKEFRAGDKSVHLVAEKPL